MLIYSCYSTPRWNDDEFNQSLMDIEASIAGSLEDEFLVVAGDFNAHSADWSSSTDDRRGGMLSDFAASIGLLPCNVGHTLTYSRVNAQSVIDVTFTQLQPTVVIHGWRVMTELNSGSDHNYLRFSVRLPCSGDAKTIQTTERGNRLCAPARGWAVKKLDPDKLAKAITTTGPPFEPSGGPESMARRLQKYLTQLCNSSMPHRLRMNDKKAAYWWTLEIADLRRSNIAAHREYQRAGRRRGVTDRTAEHIAYNESTRNLRVAIRASQDRCWMQLCRDVENDPWGTPYKLVMKKPQSSRFRGTGAGDGNCSAPLPIPFRSRLELNPTLE